MSLSALYFDTVQIEDLGDEIAVSPNFICPKCRKYLDGKITDDSPKVTLQTWKIKKLLLANREINFNQKVSFKMPCCGTEISLYVAVYKAKQETMPSICISVEPIPDGWWRVE